MSQRFREACDLTAFPLARIVEIDETYIGGKEANRHASPKKNQDGKAIVLGMRERGGKTKAINISGIDGNTLHKAIHDNVSHGSTIYTDKLRGYRGIGGTSYKHERGNHSAKEYVNGIAHTNGIESVWAVIMAYIITEAANTGQNTSMNLHSA